MRVLIADDEAMARKRLRRLLEAMPDVEVVGEAEDGLQVVRAVADGQIDLVLLDVHMPRLSGVEALKLLDGPSGPAIVLCTAHAEHALEAFDGGAVDYVLKPVDLARLRVALDRVRRQRALASPAAAASTASLGPPDRLAVATARGVVLVEHRAITHAQIDGASVVVHTLDGPLFTDLTLAELLRRLPEDTFLRVHRRAVVSVPHLRRLEPLDSGGYIAHVTEGHTVEVSRAAARELRRRWSIP